MKVGGLVLDTPRLRLRPLTVDDVPAILSWASDPEVVRNFSFFETPAGPERVRRYVEAKVESESDLLLAIFERPGIYRGNVGLHEIDSVNANARLGIILEREAWGRGLGGEALCGLTRHAFEGLLLHKVYLNVFSTNEKGLHLYEKLGFSREGVLRGEYRLRGEYHDLVRMSVMAAEWPTEAARQLLELAEGGPGGDGSRMSGDSRGGRS